MSRCLARSIDRGDFAINNGPFSIEHIAKVLGCDFVGDRGLMIYEVSSIDRAQKNEITFLSDSFLSRTEYQGQLKSSSAGACIVKQEDAGLCKKGVTLLIDENPYLAYAKLLDLFYTDAFEKFAKSLEPSLRISKFAHIDVDACLGQGCYVEANVHIGRGAIIGAHCRIMSGAYIGYNVKIGSNTYIGPSVCVTHCSIGSDCIIHAGAKIGQDGFGFAPSETGLRKVKQIGTVVIGNNVEIGANSCIDRAALHSTTIDNNVKIDNLVQIGHNVSIGTNTVIAGQVGIAGSTEIGQNVMIGGQVGIVGHKRVGDNVMIAAQSGVVSDIPPGALVGGTPAVPIKQWHRQVVAMKKMATSKRD